MSANIACAHPNAEAQAQAQAQASLSHDAVALGLATRAQKEWLEAFLAYKGREPDQNERDAFLIGEQTKLRREAYNFLADATLGGIFGDGHNAMPRHLYFVRKARRDKTRSARAPGFFAQWFGVAPAKKRCA